MHRTQIMLTDGQYSRLKDESARTGRSLAELIRNALDERYAPLSDTERHRLFDAAYGGWGEHAETGAEYVARIRSGSRRRLSGAA
jgi:hypothetical protein